MTDRILPIYKLVDGVLVRKEGDIRDPTRRYANTSGPHGEFLREFTDEEEASRDEEEAQWAAEAPQREREAQRQRQQAEAFRTSLKYESRLAAFVDILGWTDAVRRSEADWEAIQSLGLALDGIRNQVKLVNWQQANGGEEGWPGDVRATQFSDCLLISTKADGAGRHQNDLDSGIPFDQSASSRLRLARRNHLRISLSPRLPRLRTCLAQGARTGEPLCCVPPGDS